MRDKRGREKSQVAALKPYLKPTFIKGPVLTNVTAATTVSGRVPSDTTCWVARAAFGETDIRWMIFRAWLIDDAPDWFRSLYIRRGEALGTWLAGRELARRGMRMLMMPAIERKLRR